MTYEMIESMPLAKGKQELLNHLNNEKLTVHPTVSKADKDGFIRLCYLLPRKLKAGSCEILFKPDGTEWTSAVYEVRLLK